MNSIRRRFLQAGLALSATPWAGASLAQGFPDKPVRIVVPFTAGGVGDQVARLLAERLAARLGQQFIVENRPGAGGSIGTEFVARASADGYTLVLASPGFTVNPALQQGLKWDPVADFAPVSMLVNIPNVIVVGAGSPYTTLAQLVEDARRKPGELTFGSAGMGSSPHLAGELLNNVAKVKTVHVPYKGQADALADLVTGRLSYMALTAALALPQVQGGKLRALATASERRAKVFPELPTVAEAGLRGAEIDGWIALLAPARTDAKVIETLNGAIAQAFSEPAAQAALAALNCEITTGPAGALGGFVRTDRDKWAATIKAAGIQAQ
jgi:tripartite-type tricarboxylate transporter receptor subunit TctC